MIKPYRDDDDEDSFPVSVRTSGRVSRQRVSYTEDSSDFVGSHLLNTDLLGVRKSSRGNLGKRPTSIYDPSVHSSKRKRIAYQSESDDSSSDERDEDFDICFCGRKDSASKVGQMVQCDNCSRWCHFECCGFKTEDDIPSHFVCKACNGTLDDDDSAADSEASSNSESEQSDDDEEEEEEVMPQKKRRTAPAPVPTVQNSEDVETLIVPPLIPRVYTDLSISPKVQSACKVGANGYVMFHSH